MAPTSKAATTITASTWTKRLVPGAIVEYWVQGALHLGLIVEDCGTTVRVTDVSTATTTDEPTPSIVSHGEVISVWSQPPDRSTLAAALEVAHGLLESKDIHARILALHSERSRGTRAAFNSAAAGRVLFPNAPPLAASIAAARLIGTENAHFKRGPPGQGWRALPRAVAATREAAEFVKAARAALKGDRDALHCPAARAFLNALEVCAASAASPHKALARVMGELGYKPTAGAAAMLLGDLGLWARVRTGKRSPLVMENSATADDDVAVQKAPEWTFPAEILEMGRQIRMRSRDRRVQWLSGEMEADEVRRNLLDESSTAFCVDDRNTNFLDDAISVRMLQGGAVARVFVHIADVASLVEAGTPLDVAARDRAQSMYLPLRPLHMLPPPVMEAASFSTSLPTEAVTVQVDFDLKERRVQKWRVYPSVIPVVTRLSYDDVDQIIASPARSMVGMLSAQGCSELRALCRVAPLLAAAVADARRRVITRDPNAVSDVRLVRRATHGREYREARVLMYRDGGAHSVIADLLASAGAILREHAHRTHIAIPEAAGARTYAIRCGTAPMRRYADLTTQRQIRGALFGQPIEGRAEMDALRAWLSRRSAAVMNTVQQRRQMALFESLAATCARQRAAAKRDFAVVLARVGTITVSKRGVINVAVSLSEMGIESQAGVSHKILQHAQDVCAHMKKVDEEKASKSELLQSVLRLALPAGTEVRLRIDKVNAEKLALTASVIGASK